MNSLSHDMLGVIARYVANPLTTAPVCKQWNEATKSIYQGLFKDYQKQSDLNPFCGRALEICQKDDHKSLVQTVYASVLGEARLFPKDAKIKESLSLGVINDIRLAEIAHIVKAQEFNAVFNKIADIYPDARAFLNSDRIKGLVDIELADETKIWMEDNAELLKHPLHIQDFQIINLNSCSISFLPPEIGMVEGLRGLYLADNRLQAFPKEISNLTHLMHLNLDNNRFQHLPKEIGDLTNLTALTISRNPLSELDKEIHILDLLTQLQVLHVDMKQYKMLPKEILNRRGLEITVEGKHDIRFGRRPIPSCSIM
ncbi:MAG TPA: leucine-rich repeat domain-containing protein [Rhabdochlamydiaceae bacterium]|nr:leucine-rich repeat domain-containing protein [Rhabdochlamydiaceae bacterium]